MRHLLALMSLMYITVIIGNCRNFSYTLVVSSALSQNYLCYFSFTKLKIYQRPQVPLKRKKKNPMYTDRKCKTGYPDNCSFRRKCNRNKSTQVHFVSASSFFT